MDADHQHTAEQATKQNQPQSNKQEGQNIELKEDIYEGIQQQHPYRLLSAQLKTYFKLNKGQIELISPFTSPFQVKKTQHHYCTHFFGCNQQQYYTCESCSYEKSGYYMCFCLNCWIPEKHIGHQFSKQNSYNDGAYCDCGRTTRIQKESFCSSHNPQKQITLEEKITEEQKQRFINFFKPFFQIYFFDANHKNNLNFESYMTPILKQLFRLIEGSSYYSKLALQMLKTPSNYSPILAQMEPEMSKDYANMFVELSSFFSHQLAENLINHVMNNKSNMVEIGRILQKYQELPYPYSSQLQQIINAHFDNVQVNLELMKEGIYLRPLINNFLQWSYIHPLAEQLFFYSIEEKIKQAKQNVEQSQQITKDLTCLVNINEIEIEFSQVPQNISGFLLKKIFSYFPLRPEVQKLCEQTYKNNEGNLLFETSYSFQSNQEEISPQIMSNLMSSGFKTTIIKTLKYVGAYCMYEQGRIKQFRNFFKETTEVDRFQSFLFFATNYIKEILLQSCSYDIKSLICFDILALLINGSPNRQQLMKVASKSIIRKQFLTQSQEANNAINGILRIISHTVHYQSLMIEAKARQHMQSKMSQKKKSLKDIYTPMEKQFLQSSFKSYLYQKQTFSRGQIQDRRNKGFLDFEGAAKILRNLCSYDDEDQYFRYTSNERYIRPQDTFPEPQNQCNIEDNTTQYSVTLSAKYNFCEEIKNFGALFFQHSMDSLEKLFTEKRDVFEDVYRFGWLIIMIMGDKLSDGNNENIRKHIYNIKKQSFEWEFFNGTGSYIESVKSALEMDNEEEDRQQIEEQMRDRGMEEDDNLQQTKRKARQKKQKMLQKYKKTRTGVLQRMMSKSESLKNADQDDNQCLVCHERKKKNNPLLYLSYAKMGNTISNALHSEENKANFLITTCFHTIHINCFIKFEKQSNLVFNCPLCSKKVNCILPIEFDPQMRKQNKICSNILIASLIVQYQCYNSGSLFSLLLRHVIESQGINSLISFTQYESEKKIMEKNNLFIEKILDQVYTASNEEERVLLNKEYEQLLEQIKLGCKKRIYFLVQTLLAKAVFAKLNLEDLQENQLINELYMRLPSDQFAVIKQNMEKLTGSQIVIDETKANQNEGLQKQSMSFNIVRPPQTSDEFKILRIKQCQQCEEKNSTCYSLCLICGKGICERCYDSQRHRDSKHNKISLNLLINDGAISYETRSNNDWVSVYENDFRLPYNYRTNSQLSRKDTYYLNELKMNKLMVKFMDIS